ncbi:Fic family protein [Thermodesulfobacteriota bacterium]
MLQYIWQHPDWPNFCWNNDQLMALLGDCRLRQGKLLSRAGALGAEHRLEAQAEILSIETIQTAAIEGELLDRDSVKSSVARRLGLPSAGLPPSDRSADGLVEVLLDATTGCERPLTGVRIKGWQAALFPTGYSGLHLIRVGQWRGTEPMRVLSGPTGRETIHFEAPPGDQVTDEMGRFIDWWAGEAGKIEGLIRAGIAHFRFVTIHPFEDGNGRIARALTDMALAQDEGVPVRFYSLSAQVMAEREEYYSVLERSQRGDCDITNWLAWFLGCFHRAVERSENLIDLVLMKARFWQKHVQTNLTDRQRKVTNRLLDAGPGGFTGGLSTRKYVSMARTSRATAYREIIDLVQKGVLRRNPGGGRSASYDLAWPDAGEG